jgi:hypothetical protein
LRGIKNHLNVAVYTYSDPTLYGNTTANELDMTADAANGGDFLAATRANCRWIGLTVTFSPQNAFITGGINAAQLPEPTTTRVFVRAPMDPAGGLLAAVTRDMLMTNTNTFVTNFPDIVFHAQKNGSVLTPDVFRDWMREQLHQAYFYGMEQIIQAIYIGRQVATETLSQRFHRLSQRKWDPIARKPKFVTVTEFHNELLSMLEEVQGMSEEDIGRNVPELDNIFYNGLSDWLKQQKGDEMAALLNHDASATLGENTQRLSNIVQVAISAEREVHQTERLATRAVGGIKRNGLGVPVAAQGAGRANTFLSSADSAGYPPVAQLPPVPNAVSFGSGTFNSPGRASTVGGGYSPPDSDFATFALTCLSNAEKALRQSSNTNAPLECWGCKGPHLYRDCPRKHEKEVQESFKANLDSFLERRRRRGFDPNQFKRYGFPSKKAVTLFNEISDESTSPEAREAKILEFKAEGPNRRSRRHHVMDDEDETGGGQGAVIYTFWMMDDWTSSGRAGTGTEKEYQDDDPYFKTFLSQSNRQIQFPIADDLPHIRLPVGKMFGTIIMEALFDTGGACNMGCYDYWMWVFEKHPEILKEVVELKEHRIENIRIGGVGDGRVEISHIAYVYIPYQSGGMNSTIAIGLGRRMPVTLLIGLTFIVGTKTVFDPDTLKCYSKVFDTNWKVVMKKPHLKNKWSLDNATMGTNPTVLNTSNSAGMVTPSPNRKNSGNSVSWKDDLEDIRMIE